MQIAARRPFKWVLINLTINNVQNLFREISYSKLYNKKILFVGKPLFILSTFSPFFAYSSAQC